MPVTLRDFDGWYLVLADEEPAELMEGVVANAQDSPPQAVCAALDLKPAPGLLAPAFIGPFPEGELPELPEECLWVRVVDHV